MTPEELTANQSVIITLAEYRDLIQRADTALTLSVLLTLTVVALVITTYQLTQRRP